MRSFRFKAVAIVLVAFVMLTAVAPLGVYALERNEKLETIDLNTLDRFAPMAFSSLLPSADDVSKYGKEDAVHLRYFRIVRNVLTTSAEMVEFPEKMGGAQIKEELKPSTKKSKFALLRDLVMGKKSTFSSMNYGSFTRARFMAMYPPVKQIKLEQKDKITSMFFSKQIYEKNLPQYMAFPRPGVFPKQLREDNGQWFFAVTGEKFAIKDKVTVKVNGSEATNVIYLTSKNFENDETQVVSFMPPKSQESADVVEVTIEGFYRRGSKLGTKIVYKVNFEDMPKLLGDSSPSDLDPGSSGGSGSGVSDYGESSAEVNPEDRDKYDYKGDLSTVGGNKDALSPFLTPGSYNALLDYAFKLAKGVVSGEGEGGSGGSDGPSDNSQK